MKHTLSLISIVRFICALAFSTPLSNIIYTSFINHHIFLLFPLLSVILGFESLQNDSFTCVRPSVRLSIIRFSDLVSLIYFIDLFDIVSCCLSRFFLPSFFSPLLDNNGYFYRILNSLRWSRLALCDFWYPIFSIHFSISNFRWFIDWT